MAGWAQVPLPGWKLLAGPQDLLEKNVACSYHLETIVTKGYSWLTVVKSQK